uniref:Major capsid protein L1 n=1 Tax=Human papillomavirus TaxID=10566 RepID=A0A385PNM5_9PAPI|nr:MAG: L1 protein [Human papillomavirus]
MAWTQKGSLYLPPQKPVAKVYNTDEYVEKTGYFFHAGTDRLLIVGHPYFDIVDPADDKKITVPKVSANQFRVLRLELPDPNKFAIADTCLFNPEKERLVWQLVGLEVDRGGPLGIGATGHPYFNKYVDTENPVAYPPKQEEAALDSRQDMSFDPKQVQMIIVGCAPPTGEYWDTTKFCESHKSSPGDCPAIELMHTIIQDGDMCEIGFGNANFESFSQDRASVPLELTNEIVLWPDFVKMTKDLYGDQLFFCTKREQMYARHYFTKAGIDGDSLPTHTYWNPDTGKNYPQANLGPYSYYTSPSGSLVSSDSNIFNRPYWIFKALGANNGILWGNQCFITIMDNTRNINFNLSVYKEAATLPSETEYKYNSQHFKNYLRHPEEYEVELILELCKVPLEADIIAHLNVMNPQILEDWDLSFIPPPPEGIQDTYRYIQSLATKCPSDDGPKERKDPWENYSFWTINLTEKLTAELSQTPLGKRFLYQNGLTNNRQIKNCPQTLACKRCPGPSSCKRSVKRRRKM